MFSFVFKGWGKSVSVSFKPMLWDEEEYIGDSDTAIKSDGVTVFLFYQLGVLSFCISEVRLSPS